jgi:hypothetical protein
VVACQNDLDNVPVVRVALCLKAESSIDYHLKKQIGLGFILKELIADLTCDFRSSLSLTELLESRKLVLDDVFSCRASASFTLARKLITKIAEEMFMTSEEAKRYGEADQVERKAAHLAAQKRTVESHGTFMNPGERPEVGITGFKEEDRRTTDMEKSTLAHGHTAWAKRAWALLQVIRGIKAMTFEYRFDDLSRLLFRNMLVSSYLPAWVTDELTSRAGTVAAWFQRASARFEGEVNDTWAGIYNREKQERRWQEQIEEERRAAEANMSAAERKRLLFLEEKKRLQEKLQTMGITMTESDLADDEEKRANPVEMVRIANLAQIKSQRIFLETHYACWRAFVGVHSVLAQSGQNRLQLTFQGLDIFEIMPEPDPPDIAVDTA